MIFILCIPYIKKLFSFNCILLNHKCAEFPPSKKNLRWWPMLWTGWSFYLMHLFQFECFSFDRFILRYDIKKCHCVLENNRRIKRKMAWQFEAPIVTIYIYGMGWLLYLSNVIIAVRIRMALTLGSCMLRTSYFTNHSKTFYTHCAIFCRKLAVMENQIIQ